MRHIGDAQLAAERDLKRIAIQIAAQLPEHEADALAVLSYAKDLVMGYLRPGRRRNPPLRVLDGLAGGGKNLDH